MLTQAIRDDDPVMFLEHKGMYDEEEEVPDEPYTVPFGEANLTRDGDDVTIVAIGRMVQLANQVADGLEKVGIGCTVLDPRTTSPLDDDAIIESVEDTGRLVIVDEAYPRCNIATDISALACRHAFGALKAPVHHGDPAAHAGAVLARARGRIRPQRREDRSRGTRGRRVYALSAPRTLDHQRS